ncbi:MAG: endonuclease Q family protein [Candidatus Kaelpia imicola]|nr:endonuclease Q family protein [Candidatus Kaelpia imicola]
MIIADIHIHSKYSRAASKNMDLDNLSEFAKIKGVDLLGSGDFTHFLWLQELKTKLKEAGYGVYKYKGINYILTVEVSNIYSYKGRVRKIHNLIIAPDFTAVDKINRELAKYGSLTADGRPTLSLDVRSLMEIVLSANSDCFLIPCHIWTPWFGLFGANSGFDSIEECFGPYVKDIYALETGLSSDPAMNWRISDLDRYTLVSNSDSHSPSKIGREANVLNISMDYRELLEALKNRDSGKFAYTIEFYPQEGKYHLDGHRGCGLSFSPKESMRLNNICPKCSKPLTIGVMHRVEELADREDGFMPKGAVGFKSLVPLDEIIAELKGVQKTAKAVIVEYHSLIQSYGPELKILSELDEKFLKNNLPVKIAKSIIAVREGRVKIKPGFDGLYGNVKVFDDKKMKSEKQLTFF